MVQLSLRLVINFIYNNDSKSSINNFSEFFTLALLFAVTGFFLQLSFSLYEQYAVEEGVYFDVMQEETLLVEEISLETGDHYEESYVYFKGIDQPLTPAQGFKIAGASLKFGFSGLNESLIFQDQNKTEILLFKGESILTDINEYFFSGFSDSGEAVLKDGDKLILLEKNDYLDSFKLVNKFRRNFVVIDIERKAGTLFFYLCFTAAIIAVFTILLPVFRRKKINDSSKGAS